jgi:hypothetical protein
MASLIKRLRWCSEGELSSLEGYIEVDYAERQTCFYLHHQLPDAVASWPLIHNYIRTTALEMKRDGEFVKIPSPQFQETMDRYFEPLKNDLYHHICAQGVAVVVIMITEDGEKVPRLLDPATYRLFIGYCAETESKVYAAVRCVPRKSPYTGKWPVRADAGFSMEIPGPDVLTFVVDGFGFDPTLSGRLRSVVSSYMDDVELLDRAMTVYLKNLETTTSPLILTEMADDKKSGLLLQPNDAIDPGSTDLSSAESFEAGLRTAHQMSMLLDHQRANGMVPPQLSEKSTKGAGAAIRSTLQDHMSKNNIYMLPPMVRYVTNSTALSPADWQPVAQRQQHLRTVVARAYGVSAQSVQPSSRVKADEQIYMAETETSINRWVAYTNMALTSIYNTVYDEDQRLLNAYAGSVRAEMLKYVSLYLEAKQQAIERDIESKELELDGDHEARDQSPKAYALVAQQLEQLNHLQQVLETTKAHSLTIEQMHKEFQLFGKVAPQKDQDSLRAKHKSKTNAVVTMFIKKRVMHETTVDPEHLRNVMLSGLITTEEYILLERNRVGLHADMSNADMAAALRYLEELVEVNRAATIRQLETVGAQEAPDQKKDDDASETAAVGQKRARKPDDVKDKSNKEADKNDDSPSASKKRKTGRAEKKKTPA